MTSLLSQTAKSVIVTGAASGLGKAIASEFLRLGSYVTLVDINAGRLKAASEDLSAYPRHVTARADITNKADVQSVFQQASLAPASIGSGFSTVHKVKVDPSHVRGEFSDKAEDYMAMKRLDLETAGKTVFDREIKNLSHALERLAGEGCRHSDLKPQNILLFPDARTSGTLKITDLGISKFHTYATINRWDQTSAQFVTVRYGPPEFDELNPGRVKDYVDGSSNQKLSRRFDIWSLGCVFVEFLIWARLGLGSFYAFNVSMKEAKRYWKHGSSGSSGYLLHETVTYWLTTVQGLLGQTADDIAVRSVLQLVEDGMLIVECSDRYEASEVHKRLRKIRHDHMGATDSGAEKDNANKFVGERSIESRMF
ncbi:hypothetical protein CEP52_007736 [Fusarium oligoseptatum]|uniref:Protein kinase domain-containing protein n=1 Tax=Fusarium oligoseptatum TaxID=2604345 RepID=A0A428TLC1_9HYPO|nr:hypothetical protein CEP52_007736 [Fusarium oligoseptatum]